MAADLHEDFRAWLDDEDNGALLAFTEAFDGIAEKDARQALAIVRERFRRAPPLAAPAPRQQLGIDGSKFAMHGAVTSTTPPAAPAAVTDQLVCHVAGAIRFAAGKADWRITADLAKDMARAALAAAASAERGE